MGFFMNEINLYDASTKSLEFATRILTSLRENGFVVAYATEKTTYATGMFLKFIMHTEGQSAFKISALHSSVENCVSLFNGYETLKNKIPSKDGKTVENVQSLKEAASLIEMLSNDFSECISLVIEGAHTRLDTLNNLSSNVLKNDSSFENLLSSVEWEEPQKQKSKAGFRS